MASKPRNGTGKTNPYKSQKRDKYGLTPSQAAYVAERMKGKSQTQAYADSIAQPGTKRESMTVNASLLERTAVVQQRLQELRFKANNGCIATLQDIKVQLTEMAADPERDDDIRLAATRQLTPLLGGDTARIGVSSDEIDAKLEKLLGTGTGIDTFG